MKLRILILSLFLALSTQAQERRTIFIPERVLDSLNAPVIPKDLVFGSVNADLGSVGERDGVKTVCFTAVNRSGKTLEITRLNTSCGCLTARADKLVIGPGEKVSITAGYHPEHRQGPFEQRIFVYGDTLLARLEVRGTVIPEGGVPGYPVAMGALRLSRRKLSFGQASEERIAVSNTGSVALTLKALSHFLPDWLSFRTEPSVIGPSGTGDIVIRVDRARLPSGTGPLRANVIIEGLPGRPSERSIEVELIR